MDARSSKDRSTISAATLRAALATSPGASGGLLRLCGAHITGQLCLSRCSLAVGLYFEDCCFDEPLLLDQTCLQSFTAVRGQIRGIDARQSHVLGDVRLGEKLVVLGAVRMDGATIDGTVNLTDVEVTGWDGIALGCDRATIGENLELCGGTKLRSSLRLENATVHGNLHVAAKICYPCKASVAASMMHVDGDVDFDGDWVCAGTMCLAGAEIEGHFFMRRGGITKAPTLGRGMDCEGMSVGQNMELFGPLTIYGTLAIPYARFGAQFGLHTVTVHGFGAIAVDGQGVQLKGDVYLDKACAIHGRADFAGAVIDGDFAAQSTFESTDELPALRLQRSTIQGSCFVRHCRITGEVLLTGTRVGGNLDFDRSHVCSIERQAITALNTTVGRDVKLTGGFTAEGIVNFDHADIGGSMVLDGAALTMRSEPALRLRGTHIAGDLDCTGTEFTANGGTALFARNAIIDTDALLLGGFRAGGTVDLVRVQVGGALRCEDAKLEAPSGTTALDLRGAHVTGVLVLSPTAPPAGLVDLLDAQCAVLRDPVDTWSSQIRLDGFRYGCFDPEAEFSVEKRLDWLRRNAGPKRDAGSYSSRVYEQFIAVLRAGGNDEAAREVAMDRERRRTERRGRLLRPLGLLFDWTVGYGYSTRRIIPWFLGLLAMGSCAFAVLNHWWPGQLPHTSTSRDHTNPGFNPVVYTLDLLLPLVGFAQRAAFTPNGAAELLTWIYSVLRWVLAAVLVAGLSQAVRKS